MKNFDNFSYSGLKIPSNGNHRIDIIAAYKENDELHIIQGPEIPIHKKPIKPTLSGWEYYVGSIWLTNNLEGK